MLLHVVYSLEISCATTLNWAQISPWLISFTNLRGHMLKIVQKEKNSCKIFFLGNILISQMLTAAAIAIASMVYIFAEHKTPMTNGIHNKCFQGLTLGWSQQYFSHILLTHKGLPGTTMLLLLLQIYTDYLFLSLIEVAQLSI